MDLSADFDFIKAAGVLVIGGVIATFFIWGWNASIGKRIAYVGPMQRAA